ncbi:MAG: ABC transporter ATP-binding protein [Gammaproteobacteria bacterium]|nr:ABC transporter ATP-binding protein [Gammaproteobacteria bacterium]MDH5730206.1 ABC transporter ATP-binding protein [Gammaproteobacteria bacterium]
MAFPLLKVSNLKKHYSHKKGILQANKQSDSIIPAVDDISFDLGVNETLGLVGESGCGKTTTGKSILKLTSSSSGSIVYKNTDITLLNEKDFRPYRKDMQMIFQDLDAALNPKVRIRDVLREAITVHHKNMSAGEIKDKTEHLISLVNLKKSKLDNRSSELSGGEKRRVGIARVLAVEPKFIVADEPTSALDVSIQAQVVNLMRDLQNEFKLSYLFISHDLQLVEILSHRVAVMYLGRIVEMGPSMEVANRPLHPYTAILWSSLHDGNQKEAQTAGSQEANWGVFDFERPSTGCRFAPRCPVYLKKGKPSACTDPENEPLLNNTTQEHQVACHFPLG